VPFVAWILIYFSIIMWLGCEVDLWPLSNNEVKNEWISTSSPHTCLHGKDKDKFTYLHLHIVKPCYTDDPLIRLLLKGKTHFAFTCFYYRRNRILLCRFHAHVKSCTVSTTMWNLNAEVWKIFYFQQHKWNIGR